MEIPFLDLSRPENVIKEIFDDDRWVKDRFAEALAEDFLRVAEALAPCFSLFPDLNKQAEGSVQFALVAGFIHGVLDDLVVSTKLLAAGKMMASGNLMRQAIEGICASVMCSADAPLKIHNKELSYWKCVESGDPRVRTHRAAQQLARNQDILDVEADAVERLTKAKDHYDQFSHAGLVGIATRMSFGEVGQVFIGGSFDEQKLNAYRVELRERSGLASVVPNVIRTLIKKVNQQAGLPKTAH